MYGIGTNIVSGLVVIGGSSFIGFKFYQHIKPILTNESKIVDLTDSNNLLAEQIQQLNITITKMFHEQDKRISKLEIEIKYIKEKLDDR
jgi:hypothetical protein